MDGKKTSEKSNIGIVLEHARDCQGKAKITLQDGMFWGMPGGTMVSKARYEFGCKRNIC